MFVESHVTLPLSLEDAEAGVIHALHEPRQPHRRVETVGAGHLMAVGPSLLPQRLAKLVRTKVGKPRQVGRTTVLPLRWEAVGPVASLFPVLDARLGLTPVDDVTTVLSLVGTYRPPMGRFGVGVDRAVMSRAATATIDAFLEELAASVQRDVVPAGDRRTPLPRT